MNHLLGTLSTCTLKKKLLWLYYNDLPKAPANHLGGGVLPVPNSNALFHQSGGTIRVFETWGVNGCQTADADYACFILLLLRLTQKLHAQWFA
jgi:hypothetical protein